MAEQRYGSVDEDDSLEDENVATSKEGVTQQPQYHFDAIDPADGMDDDSDSDAVKPEQPHRSIQHTDAADGFHAAQPRALSTFSASSLSSRSLSFLRLNLNRYYVVLLVALLAISCSGTLLRELPSTPPLLKGTPPPLEQASQATH